MQKDCRKYKRDKKGRDEDKNEENGTAAVVSDGDVAIVCDDGCVNLACQDTTWVADSAASPSDSAAAYMLIASMANSSIIYKNKYMVPDPLQINSNQFTGKFNYYSRIEYSNLFKVENLLQNLQKTKKNLLVISLQITILCKDNIIL
jgi:hypothetical protein